ncbi:lysine exporter LysO family protein [Acinetobacter soli]|uniref:lysine exporter LysO family protein n=1 Tax=Acinetobacter soli TaxID=487316 RepID=UPI00301B2F78
MQSLLLITQILIVGTLGYFLGPRLSQTLQKLVFKVLPYFSYLLLMAVAFEFSFAFHQLKDPQQILPTALILAFTTTCASFVVCMLAYQLLDRDSVQGKISFSLFLNAIKNISHACLALMLGGAIGAICLWQNWDPHFNSWYLLLLFIFLIGIELAFTCLDRSWLSWKILVVPCAAILGSCLAALGCHYFLHDLSLKETFALSQGYGWYSMSGILLTQLHSSELGGMALLTDLFREIFAILLMYCFGWRFPRSAISSAGATSMDATLAMVKQSCGTHYVPYAMVSGIILSLLAPILMSLVLML